MKNAGADLRGGFGHMGCTSDVDGVGEFGLVFGDGRIGGRGNAA